VVRAGDVNGNSYQSWAAEDLTEGLTEVDRRGFLKGLGAAAVAGAIPLGAKAEYSSYKLTPEDIEILRHVAAVIYFGMYDKIKHKGTVGFSKDILADLKRIAKPVLDFMDDVWIMGVFDKMRVEDPERYRSYYTTVNDLESATRLHNMFQRLKDRYINGMTPDDKAKFADEMGRTHQIMSRPRESIGQGMAEDDLNELSTEKLAQYKTAASADARKADAAGDYARGDKRFKGINQATIKQFDNDLKKHGQQGVAEGADCQDMVSRFKQLAGVSPLNTGNNPTQRVYKNMPTAVQPKKEQR